MDFRILNVFLPKGNIFCNFSFRRGGGKLVNNKSNNIFKVFLYIIFLLKILHYSLNKEISLKDGILIIGPDTFLIS